MEDPSQQRDVLPSGGHDNSREVDNRQQASHDELRPLLRSWPRQQKPTQTSENQQEVPACSNHCDTQVRSRHVTGGEEQYALVNARRDEIVHEYAGVVPEGGEEATNAKGPSGISSCEHDYTY